MKAEILGPPPSSKAQKYGQSIPCPECGSFSSLVIDTRHTYEHTRRRRVCQNGHRYSTRETYLIEPLWSGYEI